MTNPLLQATNLRCVRHRRLLFENLSLTVHAGDLWQIVGANGAGKTSLLRLLCGLSRPQAGAIYWQTDPIDEAETFRENLLYLGHLPAIKDDLTARENLQFLSQLADEPTTDWAMALAAVNLTAFQDHLAGQLSAGQRRRIGLARLWTTRRPLWLLDEPLTAIDTTGVSQLEQRFSEHLQRGGAIVLTSHQALQLPHVKRLELQHESLS